MRIDAATGSNAQFTGSFKGTFSGSYVGDIQADSVAWDNVTSKPEDLVSSSIQLSSDISGSFDSLSASFESRITANSGSAWTAITGKPQNIVSSSLQLASDISGSFTSTSASLAARFGTVIPAGTVSGSAQTVANLLNQNVNLGTGDFTSSNAEFENITVNATASIAKLVSVESGVVRVGDSRILLNADTPTVRYAGIDVYDSGSSFDSASLLWDGESHDWKYDYNLTGEDHESAVLLTGPESTLATTVYPVENEVQKGTNTHHLTGSNIFSVDGDVGIGTSSPSEKLEVSGNATITGDINLGSAPAYDIQMSSTGIQIGPFTLPGQKSLQLGQNVTLADVTGPGSRFDLNVGSAGLYFNSDGSATAPLIYANADSNTGIYRVGNDDFGFTAGGSNVGGFNTNGIYTDSLVINKATPLATLDVNGNTNITGSLGVSGDGTFGNVYSVSKIGLDTDDYIQWSGNTHLDFYVGGNNEMRLESDGDLHVDGDIIAFSTTIASDETLKENIENYQNPTDILNQLNGVSFNWKKNGKASGGVIAQEVEKVLPALVNRVQNLNDNDSHLTVEYTGLIGVLIEAVKSLSARVDELENKS